QAAERAVDADRAGIDKLALQAPAAVAGPLDATRHEIVFIEDNVENYQQLVAGVKPGVEVVVLDHTRDGLQQMLAALDGHAPVDAIHLVTHGSEASIRLGSTEVSLANLEGFDTQFGKLGSALTANGDFLIYGCDVAAGADGQQFVSRLSQLTGADVAASVDLTGAAARGGNWTLETQTGSVETAPLTGDHYDGLLGAANVKVSTDNVVNTNDTLTTVTVSGTVDNGTGRDINVTVTGAGGTPSVTSTITGITKTQGGTWSGTINLSSFADGTLNVYVTQGGTAGPSATNDQTFTIVKDTTAPTVTTTNTSTASTSSFSLTASDASKVSTLEYQVDSGSWNSLAITPATSVSSTVTLATQTVGSHHLNVRATDANGNVTVSGTDFTVAAPPANHAPTASGDATLASIPDTTTNPPGASVSSLFLTKYADSDSDAFKGIAIVSYTRDASAGEWQYYNGSSWTNIGAVTSASSAITFGVNDQLRFKPASGFSGAAPALSVKLVDAGGTVSTNGVVDASVSGGSSDFSAATVLLKTSVTTTYTLSSPDSKFVTLLSGNNYDPYNDTQSHAADTDLVGNSSAPLLQGGYDTNTQTLYYRVRIGNPTLSKGVATFTGVVLLGVDVNNDGKLDIFIGVDGRNNGLGVVTFAPGADLNVSPSTTSITAPVSASGSYSYTSVTTGTTDIGGDGKTDAYLTFSLPFSALQSRVAALGKSISTNTSLGFVLMTLTQNNSINGDIGGIGTMSKGDKDKTWRDLGLLQPINLTAPTLGSISGNYQFVENGAAVTLAPNATFSDFDTRNFSGGKLEVTISGNPESGKDQLSLSASGVSLVGGAVSVNGTQVGTATFAGNVLTVNFTGSNVTADQVNAVVRAVNFSNTSDAPSTLNRTVQFKITDPDSNASDPTVAAVTVLVQAVNDAPAVSGAATSLNRTVTSGASYAVGSATTSDGLILGRGVNSGISVSDVDAASGTVRVTLSVDLGILELYNAGTRVATATTIDNVTFSGSRTGTLVLTGTLANINAILTGTNTSDTKVLYQPGLSEVGTAKLTLAVNDQGNTGYGGPLSASATVGTITISAPAPTGTLIGTVIEDNAVTSGNLSASGTLSQTITGSNWLGNTLGSSALGTLTASGATWTYTVNNSAAEVQALVAGQSIEESFQVATAGGNVFVRVTIKGTNDAPTLTATNGASGYTEKGSATTLFSSATATLGGSGASAESGQSITSITLDVSNVFDGDQIVIDGTTLYLDHSSSGTLTASGYRVNVTLSGSTATLTVDTAQASPSSIQSLVTGLAYQSSSNNPTNYGNNASRTFTLRSMQDSGGTALGGSDTAAINWSRTVTLTAVNDAPVVNVAPITVNQNTSIVLSSAYLLANDPDTKSDGLTYRITSDPTKGVVKFNGTVVTGAVTFTQQDLDAGSVTYTANPSGSATSDAFSVTVSDGTNTTAAKQVDVSIITTNYPPITFDNTVTTAEDNSYVFGTTDFLFSDFNTGDSMSTVEIFTLPGTGKLQTYVSGAWQDVTGASTMVSTSEIMAGHLRFMPVANAYGSPYATFNFKVYDQSNVASGDAQMTVIVTPVNDAPVLAVAPVSLAQGATVTLTTSYLNATDVDTGNGSLTYTVTSAPGKGTIKVSGTAATTFTQQDVIDGKVSYTANTAGSDTFTVSVSDGALSDAKSVGVTITSTNAAPTSTGGTVTTLEDTNYVFGASDFNFSDANAGDSLSKVEISALPGAGKLQAYVSGAWQDVGASASMTVAEINASHLRFVPVADASGNPYTTFTYKVYDQSNAASADATMTVKVTPVNDAPVLAVSPVTVAQGATITLTTSYLNATDVDTGNGSLTYTVTSAPGKGTIKVSGTAATTFTQQDVIDGKVSYTANTAGSDTFT
ncbi:DUF4347 domain-containing protein, partial [Massilia solisilvae]